MIERHYGTLLDGGMESIAARLDALDRERDQAEEVRADGVQATTGPRCADTGSAG